MNLVLEDILCPLCQPSNWIGEIKKGKIVSGPIIYTGTSRAGNEVSFCYYDDMWLFGRLFTLAKFPPSLTTLQIDRALISSFLLAHKRTTTMSRERLYIDFAAGRDSSGKERIFYPFSSRCCCCFS